MIAAHRLAARALVASIVISIVAACTGGGESGPSPSVGPSAPSAAPASPSVRPTQPAPSLATFADVGGWIAYGNDRGIWAVDPARPGDLEGQVQLSSRGGTPKAWSPDGSKLLVLRDLRDPEHPDAQGLFVLNADATETRLTQAGDDNDAGLSAPTADADFTPDGSHVVYGDGGTIYVIEAEGGTPELLLAGRFPLWTFSPDGTQIAYVDWGGGDWGHSVRVMNSEGTDVRIVVADSNEMGAGHIGDFGLDWSPDGQHLVFANTRGVWVVGIDGSGLVQVSSLRSEGPEFRADPYWSPDGSRISFNTPPTRISFNTPELVIARSDGTDAQSFFRGGRSGPWNPR